MMRRLRQVALLVLTPVVVVLVFAAWRVLGYQTAPAVYPPPTTALPSALAESLAARITSQNTVDREDLAAVPQLGDEPCD